MASTSKTRDKMVEVARELFAKRGIQATTMNDIADAAKVVVLCTTTSVARKIFIKLSLSAS